MSIAQKPEQYLNYPNTHHNEEGTLGTGPFELLLMRMETLQLDADEVTRIESIVFGDLAKACAICEKKSRCERDLAYASAGTVTHDWESYCPNAVTLNAMTALPWFAKGRAA